MAHHVGLDHVDQLDNRLAGRLGRVVLQNHSSLPPPPPWRPRPPPKPPPPPNPPRPPPPKFFRISSNCWIWASLIPIFLKKAPIAPPRPPFLVLALALAGSPAFPGTPPLVTAAGPPTAPGTAAPALPGSPAGPWPPAQSFLASLEVLRNASRFSSSVIREIGLSTTRSPSASPLVTCTNFSLEAPTSTSSCSKRSPTFLVACCLPLYSRMACTGTNKTLSLRSTRISTCAVMPGRR